MGEVGEHQKHEGSCELFKCLCSLLEGWHLIRAFLGAGRLDRINVQAATLVISQKFYFQLIFS